MAQEISLSLSAMCAGSQCIVVYVQEVGCSSVSMTDPADNFELSTSYWRPCALLTRIAKYPWLASSYERMTSMSCTQRESRGGSQLGERGNRRRQAVPAFHASVAARTWDGLSIAETAHLHPQVPYRPTVGTGLPPGPKGCGGWPSRSLLRLQMSRIMLGRPHFQAQ